MRFFGIVVCVAALFALPGAAAAQQATTGASIVKAYGARVGVRNEDPRSPGYSRDPRAVQRLPTRLNSRIPSRVERYADPQATLWAYGTVKSDGSRQSTNDKVAPVPSTARPIVNEPDSPDD